MEHNSLTIYKKYYKGIWYLFLIYEGEERHKGEGDGKMLDKVGSGGV